ncbi:tryptophan synthase, beta subunit [mine drainage metagenome]|uniref:tryptophan synthase n=1 Tax=mine drainage metagenome TaxID=410659 RepID=T1AUN9_9ZZZZ
MTYAGRLSAEWGAHIWLKREDLAHTGAHKINNALGQALLAQRLGARRIVAETGAGQHGVASAAACARLGLPCTVYMGAIDMERQAPNVGRMRLLGAQVVPVTGGDRTLRAAIDEALRDWVSDPLGTYYLLGSAVGPHPYPYLVRELQAVIGREARSPVQEAAGRLPDAVIACVGGGSNAIGMFHAFVPDRGVEIIGSKPADAAPCSEEMPRRSPSGVPACCTAATRCCCRTPTARSRRRTPCPAGLDYPGVGPEHALLAHSGRVRYETAGDEESLAAVRALCELEGILPALESAHALAGARRWAHAHAGGTVLVCLSGRGDKDMPTFQQTLLAERP